MKRPKRVSVGCYAIQAHGQTVLLRRQYPRGFRVEMRQGAKSQVFRRLCDAAAAGLESISPWPFPVAKKPDLAADIPHFLRRPA